jgi:hypothetical protein
VSAFNRPLLPAAQGAPLTFEVVRKKEKRVVTLAAPTKKK